MKDNKTRELLISGYGPGNNRETSIGLYEMTDGLEFDKVLWEDTVTAPSFLCTYHDICFGIREETGSGALLCFQRQGNKYVLRDELDLKGGTLCHIVYQPVSQVLYGSFYETGHVAAVKVEDFHFTEILNFFQIRPEVPGGLTRAHCSALEPDGTRVFTTNIALDRIYIYDTAEGMLIPNKSCEFVQLEDGIGPRHIKFHPLLNFLYLITEYSNEIYTFLYEKENGWPELKFLQKISTLPEGFSGASTGSGLDISKDGRFLYAANRGADTIAVYDIKPDGLLNKIQDAVCRGNCPRHISLTKDDTGLMIANQISDEVVILRVDENNGMLSEVIARKSFYAPAYVEEL